MKQRIKETDQIEFVDFTLSNPTSDPKIIGQIYIETELGNGKIKTTKNFKLQSYIEKTHTYTICTFDKLPREPQTIITNIIDDNDSDVIFRSICCDIIENKAYLVFKKQIDDNKYYLHHIMADLKEHIPDEPITNLFNKINFKPKNISKL